MGKNTRRKVMRKMRGGRIDDENEEKPIVNPNDFATYYLLKYAKKIGLLDEKANLIEQTPITSIPEGSVLYVIDMQNDFIDYTLKDDEYEFTNESKTNRLRFFGMGSFNVHGGVSCVDAINSFIKQNNKSLSRVVYTRDWHSPGHCSFGIGSGFNNFMGGKYPPHCEYNSPGAALNPKTRDMINRDEAKNTYNIKDTEIPVDIVFKGHHSDADSYGVAPYDKDYLPQRQNVNGKTTFLNGDCCTSTDCMSHTGAVKLKAEFDNKIDATGQVIFADEKISIKDLITAFASKTVKDEAKINAVKYDAKLSEYLNKKYFDSYDYPMPTGEGNIYVVGLAGEFCVKDSAINLARILKEKQAKGEVHPDSKVYVIQDLTRYVFIPFALGLQRKKLNNANETGPSTYDEGLLQYGDHLDSEGLKPVDEVFSTTEPDVKDVVKPLSQYIFTNIDSNIKRLTKEELEQLRNNNNKLMKDSWLNYWHFASDHRPLIKDYNANGVKIAFYQDIPDVVNNALKSDDLKNPVAE